MGAPAAEVSSTRQRRREEKRSRSRSRRKEGRKRRSGLAPAPASTEGPERGDRKVVLTPNVTASRDPYSDAREVAVEPTDARWQYRAEEPARPAVPPGYTSYPEMPPQHSTNGMAPGYQHAPAQLPASVAVPAPVRSTPPPTRFNVKKWKVIRKGTMVRATEALDSPEVQTLEEGAIVEQVAPAFRLKSGIVRIQIRHPSSPQFPNPIGWVTQDATAAGGPRFLEPGPEPMTKTSWTPRTAAPPQEPWAPPNPALTWGALPPSRPPHSPAPRGKHGMFQNLTWTPGSKGASGAETATA